MSESERTSTDPSVRPVNGTPAAPGDPPAAPGPADDTADGGADGSGGANGAAQASILPLRPEALRGEPALAPVTPLHPAGPPASPPGPAIGPGDGDEPPRRHRIKKLRLLAILIGLTALAAVSTVFGMMMAVASDLPALEEPSVRNSVLYDRYGQRLGLLTGEENRIFVRDNQIAPVMKHAIIAIEDRRFYTNDGVDVRAVGRALYQDVVSQRVVQGGSTITQQFVKNALAAQDERTLFNKLREAALAYHLTRKWSKEKILRNYLNTIYFGNGAYGIESAARTYFGLQHPGCEDDAVRPCSARLEPHEAALVAGVVANPTAYDPIQNPPEARRRRDLVLNRMYEQSYLTREQYDTARTEQVPTRWDIQPPREKTTYPYFTSWVKQQVVDKLGGGTTGARQAFEGGLTIQTTIDKRMQEAAQRAVDAWLPNPGGPQASVVVLDNARGEVRAMIGGPRDGYATRPFNLATQGQRQPGSAFKPFILAEALRQGISPRSTWESNKRTFIVPRTGGKEKFVVNNYEDNYSGISTLARATTYSDNAVYAQVGIKAGTRKISRLARRMGIRTKVSTNYAITLGGLKQGVTPLDMAHAYETFARGGKLVYGSMSPGEPQASRRDPVPGPAGVLAIGRGAIEDGTPEKIVELPDGEKARNRVIERRVLPAGVAATTSSILQTVIKDGTGTRATLGGTTFAAGKTGTTENYGDAWFVGWTKRYTVAVWVGYPDELKPMRSEWRGEPVAGGTYPAAIWQSFMRAAQDIDASRGIKPEKDKDAKKDDDAPYGGGDGGVPVPGTTQGGAPSPAPTAPAPSSGGGGGNGGATPEADPPAAADPGGGAGGGGGGGGSGGGAAPPAAAPGGGAAAPSG